MAAGRQDQILLFLASQAYLESVSMTFDGHRDG